MSQENRLANEQSPYLIQHKNNPVNWYPWSEEAFKQAKLEDKPIFLSIGYSTCHWCHVMEHESFADENIAKEMNETFISIKVDREERPDIDSIYMNVCQMMTGSGGWPLTVIMTPDKKPFFAGTYFPPKSRGGRLGMKEIIDRTKQIWVQNRDEIITSANEVTAQLNIERFGKNLHELPKGIYRKTYHELASSFDEEYGGFGSRPKFPVPHNLLFLLKYFHFSGNKDSLDIALKTLESMRKGGIYDHIGYGFHRYSTDSEWLVPHFEKMLYDQALLLMAYAEAYKLTGRYLFKKTAIEVSEYLVRDMQSEDGAYYSAEDADSEGEEGKYYLWEINEIRKASVGDADFVLDAFNIKEEGNFIDEFVGALTSKNIPHIKGNLVSLAEKYQTDEVGFFSRLDKVRENIFQIREQRIKPHLDDKILTDWNSLLMASFAYAGKLLSNDAMIGNAINIQEFIHENMIANNDELFHRYRNKEAGIPGMLDDYASYIFGLIQLYQATQNPEYLEMSDKMMNSSLRNFWDEDNAGFFFTAKNAEKLISRQKEIYDGAIPSGNSLMLRNLLSLYKITGKSNYMEKADQLIKYFSDAVSAAPSAHTMFVSAASMLEYDGGEIVLCGDEKEIKDFLNEINKLFLPNTLIISKTDQNGSKLEKLADYTKSMIPKDGKATAYLCRNFACENPVHSPKELIELINKNREER